MKNLVRSIEKGAKIPGAGSPEDALYFQSLDRLLALNEFAFRSMQKASDLKNRSFRNCDIQKRYDFYQELYQVTAIHIENRILENYAI